MGQFDRRTPWQYEDSLVEPQVDYHAQWHAFAIRRYTALFFVYTWIPLSVSLFLISRLRVHQPILFGCIIWLWLGIAIAAVWWAGEFRCPRCRRRYGALGHKKGDTNMTRGLFEKVCVNCKLAKFERIG